MSFNTWDRYLGARLLKSVAAFWLGLTLVALVAFWSTVLLRFPLSALPFARGLLAPMVVLAASAMLAPSIVLGFALTGRSIAQEGEFRVMHVAGCSPWRLRLSLAIAALLITVAALPWFSSLQSRAYRSYRVESRLLLHHPEVLLPLLKEDPTSSFGLPLVFGAIEDQKLKKVALRMERDGESLWILAESAKVRTDPKNLALHLSLEEGIVDSGGESSMGLAEQSTVRFEEAKVRLDASKILQPESTLPSARALSNAQLLEVGSSPQALAILGYPPERGEKFLMIPTLRYMGAILLGLLGLVSFWVGARFNGLGTGLWLLNASFISALWLNLDRQVMHGNGGGIWLKMFGLSTLLPLAIALPVLVHYFVRWRGRVRLKETA